jgi:hypothetical protein
MKAYYKSIEIANIILSPAKNVLEQKQQAELAG